jgi:hypothetical protein
MRLFATIVYFLATVGTIAQHKWAPLPAVIIICGTNLSAPVTIIHTSPGSWREDYVKQQSVITNLDLTCMSARSVTSTRQKDGVTLVLRGVTVYGPTIVTGGNGQDQWLQTMTVGELAISLLKTQKIQVNGEILSADRFAQRFKAIPEQNPK